MTLRATLHRSTRMLAEPGGRFRALNEEEAVVAGDTQPKPRPRWYVNKRG